MLDSYILRLELVRPPGVPGTGSFVPEILQMLLHGAGEYYIWANDLNFALFNMSNIMPYRKVGECATNWM